jgi:hypothetical protein
MADFSWLAKMDDLSPAGLTVRAQSLSPNDMGRLRWDIFFPRVDVDSVNLQDIVTIDERPVADRREWNGPGRYIPLLTPDQRKMSIIPVEAYDKIGEYEMQRINEGAFGNQVIFQQVVGTRLPNRVDRLVMANYRRLEVDAFKAWATGTIVQRNPQDASKTVTASFGFSNTRLQTAGTAWNDAGLNAYDTFLAWLRDGIDAVGPIAGVVLRQATRAAILADAPNLANAVKMTRAQLEERIQDDLGSPFAFYEFEDSLDVYNDGGTAVTRTKVWPTQKVAIVPAGTTVGVTAFAPVIRAMDIARQVPNAGVDLRGQTVFYDAQNAGKELEIQAQVNAMPVPDENKIFVIDAGV